MGQPFSPGRPIAPARTPTEPRLTAWPRRAALSPAVLGARPRAVEALSLTPPPLPRVKFLLMDAGGSPQAETRWSDPITLHQGTLGRGCPDSVKWSCSAAPSTPRCRGSGCLVAVFKSGEPSTQTRVLGVGHRLCPAPHVCHSWVPWPQLNHGQQQPSPPMGASPGPALLGERKGQSEEGSPSGPWVLGGFPQQGPRKPA